MWCFAGKPTSPLIRSWSQVTTLIIKLNMIIDFSINGLCRENRPLSQRTQTQYKIKVYKLIDFVMRIELTRVICMS